MTAKPETLVPLVHDLFDKENGTAVLDIAVYLKEHPEDLTALLSLISFLGREVVQYAASYSSRSAEEILDFLRVKD